MDSRTETEQIKETIQEIVSDERYYNALVGFIEEKKLLGLAALSSKRKGSLMDDMGKLLHNNSLVAVLDDLLLDLRNQRTNSMKEKGNV